MTENTKDETIKHLEEFLRKKSALIENMEKKISGLEKENKKLWEKNNEFESACIKLVELMEEK